MHERNQTTDSRPSLESFIEDGLIIGGVIGISATVIPRRFDLLFPGMVAGFAVGGTCGWLTWDLSYKDKYR